MSDEIYEIVANNNKKAVGYIVERGWWQTWYVPLNSLRIGSNNIVLGHGNCPRRLEFDSDKNFFHGKTREALKFVKAEGCLITEVEKIPDWVDKSFAQVQKDIEKYREEKYKNGIIYKVLHCLSRKKKE